MQYYLFSHKSGFMAQNIVSGLTTFSIPMRKYTPSVECQTSSLNTHQYISPKEELLHIKPYSGRLLQFIQNSDNNNSLQTT